MNYKSTILSASIILIAAASSLQAQLKFAFLSPDARNQANSAIYNGAREALSELSQKYGKKMDIEFMSASMSEKKQLSQLSKAYIEGFAGAIVLPIDAKAMESETEHLVKNGFPIASVGAQIKSSTYFCDTDAKAAIELAKKEIDRLSKGVKVQNYCYFYSQTGTVTSATDAMNSPISGKEVSEVFEYAKPVESANIEFYSDYVKENFDNIRRRDNYGEIFLTPRLLANMSPIKKDRDRVFVFCLGALPQLDFYLSNGQLDSCVYDDWYGWGYFAMRALVEKVVEGIEPEQKIKFLKPLKATPQTVNSFRRDWAKWL